MDIQRFYSIGETAEMAGTTIETLRHYDRIGLLKPAKVDSDSHYRYYTDNELVYLEVISFCRRDKMPLAEIKKYCMQIFQRSYPFYSWHQKIWTLRCSAVPMPNGSPPCANPYRNILW